MAVNITTVHAGRNQHVVDIEATADGDLVAVITHLLGTTPLDITITGLNTDAQLSLWVATTINSSVVVVTKTTAVGSGGAGNQVRVIVRALLSTWPLVPIRL